MWKEISTQYNPMKHTDTTLLTMTVEKKYLPTPKELEGMRELCFRFVGVRIYSSVVDENKIALKAIFPRVLSDEECEEVYDLMKATVEQDKDFINEKAKERRVKNEKA